MSIVIGELEAFKIILSIFQKVHSTGYTTQRYSSVAEKWTLTSP